MFELGTPLLTFVAGVYVLGLLLWLPATLSAPATVATTDRQWDQQHGVMHNVSDMIETLLDGYDMRLRPQFGGTYIAPRPA